ncbi:hypothetical protein H4582DRAFT_1776109, partial [Lactarius indigo]
PHENFQVKHTDPGLLSMTSIANTNDCQFFIMTASCDPLNWTHVVFGMIDGMRGSTLRDVETVPRGPNNLPKLAVDI